MHFTLLPGPPPRHTCFIHVASAPTGDAVAFSVMACGSGRTLCCGVDSDLNDNYRGDILLDKDGKPLANALVRYLRGNKLVSEVRTDLRGRHRVDLAPGTGYVYSYFLDDMGSTQPYSGPFTVDVARGYAVSWEDVDSLRHSDVMDFSGTMGDPLASTEQLSAPMLTRELGMVREVGLCDWNIEEDNKPFSWMDVEETIVRLYESILAAQCDVRHVTFSGDGRSDFARMDMMSSLSSRGVPAFPSLWRDLHFAAAYRNIATLTRTGLITYLPYVRRAYQLTAATRFATEKRVDVVPGSKRYIADATVAAAYYAALAATYESDGESHFMTLDTALHGVEPMRDHDGNEIVAPRSAQAALAGVLRGFGVK